MLKEVIIFASGCAIGAAIAVPITINKVAKREQDRADQKTRSKDEYIAELEAKNRAHEMSVGQNYIPKDEKIEVKEEKEEKKAVDRDRRVILRPPVRDYSVYYQEKAENEHPMEEYFEEKLEEKGTKIVSNEEYWSPEYEHHDKCELNYFVEDEILADSNNEVVEKEYILIGNSIRDSGFNKNSEPVLYVRNYELSTDYEIAKVYGAYSEYV